LRGLWFHFGWRAAEFLGELRGADMKAEWVGTVWKPSGNRDRRTSFFRIGLIGKPGPARDQNKHSVPRIPGVIFPGVHFHQFSNFNRHKIFVVAPVKEFALTLTVKKSHDHMKPLVIVRANDSMVLVAVAMDGLAISRFHLLSSIP
jgi:hypothetical protein